jgi:hypothetical protein
MRKELSIYAIGHEFRNHEFVEGRSDWAAMYEGQTLSRLSFLGDERIRRYLTTYGAL